MKKSRHSRGWYRKQKEINRLEHELWVKKVHLSRYITKVVKGEPLKFKYGVSAEYPWRDRVKTYLRSI